MAEEWNVDHGHWSSTVSLVQFPFSAFFFLSLLSRSGALEPGAALFKQTVSHSHKAAGSGSIAATEGSTPSRERERERETRESSKEAGTRAGVGAAPDNLKIRLTCPPFVESAREVQRRPASSVPFVSLSPPINAPRSLSLSLALSFSLSLPLCVHCVECV